MGQAVGKAALRTAWYNVVGSFPLQKGGNHERNGASCIDGASKHQTVHVEEQQSYETPWGEGTPAGTHEQLLENCDEYRSIYESQTKNQAQPEELQ